VTPTKALGLSHVKGLLWVDTMYRATRLLTDADYLYSHTTYNTTRQTAGFWEYLDRACPDVDASTCTEDDVGRLYVGYQAEARERPTPEQALRPYIQAVEDSGWVHPVSRRVLDLWVGHYAWLGLHDPGITQVRPPGLRFEEAVDLLARHGLCLDMRRDGGPVFLDATAQGLPLRTIATPTGHPNSLACALRELIPLLPRYERVVLVHDRELTEDYILLDKICTTLGATVHRVALDRVPVDNVVRSSRHGVERRHTLAGLADELGDHAPAEALRLGMRLYFIAGLGKSGHQSFRMDRLRCTVDRAAKLLAGAGAGDTQADTDAAEDVAAFLRRHTGGRAHVDPYRLTSALLARHRRVPLHPLAHAVYS
jgi:hypothetical protein